MKEKGKKDNFNSALKVLDGVAQPSQINEIAINRIRNKHNRLLPINEYIDGILNFNRTIFSRAITLVESSNPKHQEIAQELISKCLPYSGKSIRIGITGVPGAGKSTLIEALGNYIITKGRRLAVLAIDPSSTRSKGSILGDKTRMESLSIQENAFIRPSPSAGSLGGVARKTREIVILCEAAGFDTVFVETVGVGQSETAVHSMVDFFLLVLISGAGDELQGIKRGIMEMADAIVVNKADGDNINKADIARSQIANALHFFPPSDSGWDVPALSCSALTNKGISELWETITNYIDFTQEGSFFDAKRKQQSYQIMIDYINESLKSTFYNNAQVINKLDNVKQKLFSSEISPYEAVDILLKNYNGLK